MRLRCGSWPSPLSARDVYAADTVRSTPQVDGTTLHWLEARPADEGRLTLVRQGADGPVDVSPAGMNVRTRFQEYGGAAFAVSGGLALAVDFATQQVWRIAEGEEPRPVTPPSDGLVRFACFRIDHGRGVAFCLREDQRDATVEPVAALVRLDLEGPNDELGTVLVPGRVRPHAAGEEPTTATSPPDFLSDPVLSPDGRRIAWLSWNHPGMAWDGTWLHVGSLDASGDLRESRVVAGAVDEALEQPRWLDDDRLTFLTDRSGWSNHAVVDLRDEAPATVPLHVDEHEFGIPRWVPDMSSYDVLPDGRLLTARTVDGFQQVGVLDPGAGAFEPLDSTLTAVMDLRVVDASHAVCRAFFRDSPAELVTLDLRTGATTPVVTPTSGGAPAGLVSVPEPLSWTSEDGETAYGFLYPPAHPDAQPLDGELLPPLLVTLHGGPTAAARPGWTASRTFWTSRGFAVLDVNYAGSTGFGRAYRKRLDGAWGVADVADVASGVRHLVREGRVDRSRVAITGGSAGGFTTLACLAFTDVFSAGASHFGVTDLALLARDTHKLESRYLWGLVAPWPAGEEVYAARSPIHHLDRMSAPLILLQGTDDRVVPPAQAEQMAEALREKGLPFALVMFEGEGHGFRALAAQVRALECELSFYAQVFGFEPADDLEPVQVERP